MVFKKTTAKVFSAFTASLMLVSLWQIPKKPETEASAAGACVIDTQQEFQTIRGFGGMNHPEWTGQDLTDAQRQTAFGNGTNELGLTVLRVFVNPDKNQWNKAVPTAKFATKMGATVFASPWEPPSNLAESGGSNGKLHIPKSNYGAYAQHLNDFGTYMKNNGVDLYSISVQNEPDYASEWTYWSTDEAVDFMANYGDKITSTRLMSPESFQYAPLTASWVKDGGKKFYQKIMANSKAFANCDVFGTHMYGTQRDWMDYPELEKCGKEIWMTEVYVPNSEADSANRWPESLQVSENIHNALVVGNMSAYTWWYIRRSYGLMTEDGKISKRGYNMAQYSKWVRPGDVRIAATEQPNSNVLVSAYKNDDGQLAIVAINKGSSEVTQEFNIGSGEKITNVDRYRTSSNENLALTKNMNASETGFFSQLPANSVSTFVVNVGDGTPLQPNEFGWWYQCGFENGDDNWTNRGGNTVSQSDAEHYTQYGSHSLLVSDRTSSWMGASYELNSKIFEAGKAYSFSAHVKQKTEEAVKFMMKIEYTDDSGETAYDEVASVVAPKDTWAQLVNTSYTIPKDASNVKIYIETEESLTDFYIDEAIGAVDGTGIAGEGQPTVKIVILGDVNFDGVINIFDVVAARKYIISGITDSKVKKAADVDRNGKFEAADLVLIHQYVMGKITEFPKAQISIDTEKMEAIFNSVNPLDSWKKDGENNVLWTQRFGADPGFMVYKDRLYVYTTNDAFEYDNNGQMKENSYDVQTINCFSSADLVNWTDHGAIPVAGRNNGVGAAKWASFSWAPDAAWKTINGKDKFFLYFADSAGGIGVLEADSPVGPFRDPIGKALINKSTPGFGDVEWLFDPAVLVDDDGTGYLYVGGGVPSGKQADPGTARCIKLGDDMVSLSGSAQRMNPPYLFEDSSILKADGTYYYSYCTNWNTGGNPYGFNNADICVMTSKNPLGPFTYQGVVFKNPASYQIDGGGNNHHSIVEFKGKYYVLYHSRVIERRMGVNGGSGYNYRSCHIDNATFSGGKFSATLSMKGVSQIESLDPYAKVQAETMSSQSKNLKVNGLGDTTVAVGKGDWFRTSGADFGSGASSLTMRASAKNGAVIKVCVGSAKGNAIAYVEIPAGGSMEEIEVPVIDSVTGSKDLYFVSSGDAEVDWWQFAE